MVDHFRVVRGIGQGGMGEVYLARDLRLGRKVAIKVIRPAALGGRTAVDRFLSEARATARFNHPNIVTIYAVGEIEDRPYVALEFVDGQTLAARLRDGPLALMEAVRLGLAISEAVAEAHANAVVHRDLKPENVIIGRDGRPRVVDFGLARVVSEEIEVRAPGERSTGAEEGEGAGVEHDASVTRTAPAEGESAICGTPLYMSPEQWRGQPASKASDVWSIGLMLYEMLDGRHPWGDLRVFQISAKVLSSSPVEPPKAPIPRELEELLARCLSKTPEDRPSSAALCESLRAQLHAERRSDKLERGPFRGLLAFDDRHADLFFGREAETDAFVERLRDEPILAVVAHSGAGKSSFVQAGVIPRLRELHRTVVLRLRPGAEPLRALAARIASGDSASSLHGGATTPASDPTVRETMPEARARKEVPSESIERDLRASPERSAVYLSDLAERQGASVLLFVDQLEEVFTLGASEEEGKAFLRALASAADDGAGSVRVCFTLRDDFVGRVADSGVARQLLAGLFVLQTPTGERLRDILQRALSAVGYEWESPELLQEMTEAVRGESAALPLLQFAGQMMWERRDRVAKRLTREAYEQVGGVAGALARHADAVLLGMSPAQTGLARTLLLRLVTPQNTRRVLERPALLSGLDAQANEVLQMLVEGRLVIARGRTGTAEEGQVEIAHEAMIAAWGRLARWLEEARDELGVLVQAEQAAELWDRRGRRDEEVWQGDALGDALRRARRTTRELPPVVREFLDAGRKRELRTQRRRRAALAVTVSALAGVAVVLALQNRVSQKRRDEAEAASEVAQTRRAEALYEGARAALERLDPLEARARLRSSLELRDMRLARPLWWKLKRTPMRWSTQVTSATNEVAISPDGSEVAIGGNDGTVFRVDSVDRSQEVFRGITGQITSVDFGAPDTLWVRTWNGQLSAWTMDDHRLRAVTEPEPASAISVVDPGGKWAATLFEDGTVRLIDPTKGEVVRTWRAHEGRISAGTTDGAGRWLAVGAESGRVRVFEVPSGRQVSETVEHAGRVRLVHVVSDTHKIQAFFSFDKTLRTFDLDTGRELASLPLAVAAVSYVAFEPSGTLVAYGSADHSIRVVEVSTGQEKAVLRGHPDQPYRIAFDRTGRVLGSSSMGKDVVLWDLGRGAGASPEPRGHSSEVHGLSVSPDGSRVASGGTDQTIRCWDTETGELRWVARGQGARVNAVAFRPDGKAVASAAMDGVVRIWDAATGASMQAWEGGGPLMSVSWTADGRKLVSVHLTGAVRVWTVETGRLELEIGIQGRRPWVGELHSDGRTMALGMVDGGIRIVDVVAGKELRELSGHQGAVWSVQWSEGGRLYSAAEDGKVMVWEGGKEPGRLVHEHTGRAAYVAVQGAGERVGVFGAGGYATVLEPGSGRRVALTGHRVRDVNIGVFLPGGERIATAADDGTVRLWRVADGEPLWRGALLYPKGPLLLSHRGWVDPADGKTRGRPEGAWVSAVEKGCRLADILPDASRLCFAPDLGRIESWALPDGDKGESASVGAPLRAVVARGSGCVVLTSDGRAAELGRGKGLTTLAESVDAIARSSRGVLVAGQREVRELDAAGRWTTLFATDIGVTAVADLGEWIGVGYREGGLEVVARDGGRRRAAFEVVPTSAVERIVAGPSGALIAGYATGDVGIWDTESGSQLMRFGLHGPAVHLMMDGKRLVAATELGDSTVVDLREYDLDYCSLLGEVWEGVPVVWEGGQEVKRERPAGHVCAVR